MSKFDVFLAAVIDRATGEARGDGSGTVEAHHLLLALAGHGEPSTTRVLAQAGLDQAAIRAALQREFERSLGAAGVSAAAAGTPQPAHARDGNPQMGASLKLALERGLIGSRRKDLRPAHLLLGIVAAPVGTVPRALALAEVDQSAFTQLIRAAITEDN